MNLIPILLIKKAQEERRSRSSRSSSSSSSSHSDSDYSSSYSYSTPKTLAEYTSRYGTYSLSDKLYSRILTVMQSNPDIMRVYGSIHTHIASCINAYTEEAILKYADFPAIEERFEEAKRVVLDKVTTVPVVLHDSKNYDPYRSLTLIRYNPDATESSSKVVYKNFKLISIYGLRITPDMMKAGNNPFRDMYEKYLSNHQSYEEDYISAKTKVEKLSKSKFLLKISSKRREKLERAQEELKVATGIKERVETYLSQATNFDNLSNEERAYLLEYAMAEERLQTSSGSHKDELRTLLELSGKESLYYGKGVVQGFYQEAVDSLSPADREIYDSAPRIIMSALARADEAEFESYGVRANEKPYDTKFTIDKVLNEDMVTRSVAVLSNIPLDELADTTDTAE